MREILFRGKRIDNGEWVYSQTVFSHLANFYIPAQNLKCTVMQNLDTVGNISEIRCKDGEYFFKVQTETVGQFTGLTDKNNGAKIFEGDIIKGKFCNYVIWFDETERAFVYGNSYKGGYRHHMSDYLLKSAFPHGIEVIGNVHDNSELLGGDDK